jgi:SAM-dependent methyltransferase
VSLIDRRQPQIAIPDNPAAALFQREWHTYRKMVDHNYLFHSEVYARLRQILLDEAPPRFRFLDIACGDAGAIVTALKGTSIANYHGIDLSRTAIDIAGKSLAALACPVELREGDLAEALHEWSEPIDVAWIGLSLHHFHTPAKLDLMREVRRVLRPGGLFLIYENTSRDGEDRESWLRRWDEQKSLWTAYTPEEWNAMMAHVHASDFPEANARWHELGQQARFSQVRELFVAPTDLFRMYCFRA